MGTPIPSRETEMKGRGAGPVTTYRLTPEEMADLPPAKAIPRSHHKPLNLPTREEKEEEPDVSKPGKLTKEFLQSELAQGKSAAQIERELGMKLNTIFYFLKKWGLKSQHAIGERTTTARSSRPAQKNEPVLPVVPPTPQTSQAELTVPEVNERSVETLPPASEPSSPLTMPPAILPRPSTRFRRSFVVDLSGSREEIENELSGILAYVHATSAEKLHLKLSVGEMAEQ